MDAGQEFDSTTRRRCILFVAEAVTLAHVARPILLAQALDSANQDVQLAWDPRFENLFPSLPFRRIPIKSISTAKFLRALANGEPVYDANTLRAYVKEDLAILRQTKPSLVVGDFRLSLAVSAELSGIPYATITNAYWSPYAKAQFPVPDLTAMKLLGLRMPQALFNLVRPLAFAYHSWPLNQVRAEYNLAKLGPDLRRIYTHADYTLYADVPELLPTFNLPDNHKYLGPILWSPAISKPDWWTDVPSDQPLVYVTLGSSGQSELLPVVFDALADLPVSAIVATAGRAAPMRIPRNVFVADYLPGNAAAARADLVICNGGSPTTHQALAAGVPVLGIASNMDQLLSMEAIMQSGAGTLLRGMHATTSTVQNALTEMLGNSTYTQAAQGLARIFERYDAPQRFVEFTDTVLGDANVDARFVAT